MPLSSVLGAQSLVRPGVCTSSTRPASPFEGQLIFETDTNRVVAYDGSNWVYAVDTDQPPGLQLIKAQTVGSAVSSVAVSDVFSADYENYKVIMSGTDASTDGQFMTLTFGSTTAGYYGSLSYGRYGSTNGYYYRNNAASLYAGFTDSSDTTTISFEVMNPFASLRTAVTGSGFGYDYTFTFSGMVANTTSYTAFTLAPGSGTITGGTIRVYGYRNS